MKSLEVWQSKYPELSQFITKNVKFSKEIMTQAKKQEDEIRKKTDSRQHKMPDRAPMFFLTKIPKQPF